MKKSLFFLILLFFPLSSFALQPSSTLEIAAESNLKGEGITKTIFSKTTPEITLSKWNGQATLGIQYLGLPTHTAASISKNIEWASTEESMEADPLEPSATVGEDGGVEININLTSKPSTNIFPFLLKGTSDVDFFYQPALKNENPDGSTWEETGHGTRRRLANVVGSYAVYSKTFKNYTIGQTNYGTGKICQIYRPLVTDANGKTTWATLDVTNDILTVTVPQDFLDNAVYPVVVDPTFGYTTQGASQDNPFYNIFVWNKATSNPASNGTLTSVSMIGQIKIGAPGFAPAVYDEVAGIPGNIIAAVNAGGTLVGSGIGTVTTNLSGSVTSGTQYWLGWALNAGQTINDDFWMQYDSNGGALELYFDASALRGTNSDPWPSNPSSGILTSVTDERASIYATYTAASAGSSIQGILSILGISSIRF